MAQRAASPVERAIATFQAGRHRQAVKGLKQHLKRHGRDPAGWRVLAEMQNRGDDPAGARKSLEKAAALEPDRGPTFALLGITLVKLGQLRAAEVRFRQALALDPNAVDAWVNLASCLRMQDRAAAAIEAYGEALALTPGDVDIRLALGRCLQAAARDREAAEAFRAGAAQAPGRLDLKVLLATALAASGQLDEALAIARRTANDFPRDPLAQSALADLLRALGQGDEAAAAYRSGLALAPDDATAMLGLSHVSRAREDDPIFARAESLFSDPTTAAKSRMVLGFATGAVLARRGRHGQAFERFLEGNRLKRHAIDFDMSRIESEFSPTPIVEPRRAPVAEVGSPRPIMIVGMPRSGTTLVEQILASHPAVAAGGELPLLQRLVLDLTDLTGDADAAPGSLSDAQAALCAATYRSGLSGRAQGKAVVTDKAPLNFRHLGWATALLPDVRVIHCLRDPMDTCLSCFCRLFGDGRAEFSYDLAELGATYRLYRALMDHWHEVLPGRILDLSYEALVTDQEAVSRQLLAFCGLDWDPQVLDFHRTRRSVQTASAEQVRRPITTASVGRWRHYDADLAPLKDALGPFAPG